MKKTAKKINFLPVRIKNSLYRLNNIHKLGLDLLNVESLIELYLLFGNVYKHWCSGSP